MSVTGAGVATDDGSAVLGGAADDGDVTVAGGTTGIGGATGGDGCGSRTGTATLGMGTLATGGEGSDTAAGATSIVAAVGVGRRMADEGVRSLKGDAGVLGAVGRDARSVFAMGGSTDGFPADATSGRPASTAVPRAIGTLLGTIVVPGNARAARSGD